MKKNLVESRIRTCDASNGPRFEAKTCKMKLMLYHRAIPPRQKKRVLDRNLFGFKGCWSPTPLAVNEMGNL